MNGGQTGQALALAYILVGRQASCTVQQQFRPDCDSLQEGDVGGDGWDLTGFRK